MRFISLLFFILWFSLAVADTSYSEFDYHDYDDYGEGESFIRNRSMLWENGLIPYIFEDSAGSFSAKEKAMVIHAMNIIESQLVYGCIKFTEVDAGCIVCLKINKAYNICKTTIGIYKGDPQMKLGHDECFADNGITVLHELVHSIGLVHEQTRPDRDDYIDVNEDLLLAIAKAAWKRRNETFGETYKTPYDVFSVMHYPLDKGCKNNTRCITLKQPYRNIFSSNGSKLLEKYPEKLSPVDIYEISSAYNCPVYSHVKEQYLNYSEKINSEVRLTVFGERCLDECKYRKYLYFWCHKEYSEIGFWRNGDYCSNSPNYTNSGEGFCEDECLQRGEDFFWCNKNGGGWGYCSPKFEPEIYPLITIDDVPAQCSEYMILDEEIQGDYDYDYDYDDDFKFKLWKGEGYYRIMVPMGTQLPEYAPGYSRCGYFIAGWLIVKHPDDIGVEVNMTVCIASEYSDCYWKYDTSVTNCNGYYVYFLTDLSLAIRNYC